MAARQYHQRNYTYWVVRLCPTSRMGGSVPASTLPTQLANARICRIAAERKAAREAGQGAIGCRVTEPGAAAPSQQLACLSLSAASRLSRRCTFSSLTVMPLAPYSASPPCAAFCPRRNIRWWSKFCCGIATKPTWPAIATRRLARCVVGVPPAFSHVPVAPHHPCCAPLSLLLSLRSVLPSSLCTHPHAQPRRPRQLLLSSCPPAAKRPPTRYRPDCSRAPSDATFGESTST